MTSDALCSNGETQFKNNFATDYDPLDLWNLKGTPTVIINSGNGRRTAMVDFAKIKEDNARKAALLKEAGATSPATKRKLTELEMINLLIDEDPGEWNNNFLLSIKAWLRRAEGNTLSFKQDAKLKQIAYEFGIEWLVSVADDPVPLPPLPAIRSIRSIPIDDDEIPF